MSEYRVRLPDVGEGIAEAEIVEWHVSVGDTISEDDVIAEVMTDKATIELPSPVDGIVRWLAGEVGDVLAVGSDLVRIDTGGVRRRMPDADADVEADTGSPTADGAGRRRRPPRCRHRRRRPQQARRRRAVRRPLPLPQPVRRASVRARQRRCGRERIVWASNSATSPGPVRTAGSPTPISTPFSPPRRDPRNRQDRRRRTVGRRPGTIRSRS